MTNQPLDDAVERLLRNRRFLRRFRRNPERALRRCGLTATEIEAVKRGRADELIALGLDRGLVSPAVVGDRAPLAGWLFRNAGRLAPASLLAAATLVLAPAAQAPALGRRRESTVKINDVVDMPDGYVFKGVVNSENRKCERGRPVLLFHKIPGDDFLAGVAQTNRKGKWKTRVDEIPPGQNRFYAFIDQLMISAGTCEDDKSPGVRVRHEGS